MLACTNLASWHMPLLASIFEVVSPPLSSTSGCYQAWRTPVFHIYSCPSTQTVKDLKRKTPVL